jgi:hypothetical protein
MVLTSLNMVSKLERGMESLGLMHLLENAMVQM